MALFSLVFRTFTKTVCIYSSKQFSPSPVLGLTDTSFFPPFPPCMPDFRIISSSSPKFPLQVMHMHTFVSLNQSGLFCLQPAIHFVVSEIKQVRCGSRGLTAQQSHLNCRTASCHSFPQVPSIITVKLCKQCWSGFSKKLAKQLLYRKKC